MNIFVLLSAGGHRAISSLLLNLILSRRWIKRAQIIHACHPCHPANPKHFKERGSSQILTHKVFSVGVYKWGEYACNSVAPAHPSPHSPYPSEPCLFTPYPKETGILKIYAYELTILLLKYSWDLPTKIRGGLKQSLFAHP